MTRHALPAGFLWGTATAAYQIEGAAHEDGRGPSIWDTFSHTPGKVRHGDTGDVACDHYHRMEEDLDLLATLGVDAYRFSVAWPRVLPHGTGEVNDAGLEFYRRLVAGLRDRGIRPVVTLYHWDLPQALEDHGGWLNRETATHFGTYATVVADALGDDVALWITLNEPWVSAWLGYGFGIHAPGRHQPEEALVATHHLLLGHGLALAALRTASATPVGITLNLTDVRAASEHPDDQAAAARMDGIQNRLYFEPVFSGRYPDLDALGVPEDWVAALRAVVHDRDLEVIGAGADFLGVNYYSPMTVADPGRALARVAEGLIPPPAALGERAGGLKAVPLQRLGAVRTATNWEVDPTGLAHLLDRLGRDVPVPLYVTENGAAIDDYVNPTGTVNDPERIEYLDGHISAALAARERGVDLRGYFVWSLLDNFEWAEGYSKRFGLVFVDYGTGRRTPKDSFRWYHERIASARGAGLAAGEAAR
jgi:beta-glucosidase